MLFEKALHETAGGKIRERRVALAALMTEAQFLQTPGLRERLGETDYEKSIRDAEYNLEFLGEAIASGDRDGFGAYLVWLDGVLAAAGLAPSILDVHLHCMAETLSAQLDRETGAVAVDYVRAGVTALVSSRSKVAR